MVDLVMKLCDQLVDRAQTSEFFKPRYIAVDLAIVALAVISAVYK